MKALMYNGIGRLDYEDAPDPEGDFIVKVSGCGVCGTDLKAFLNGHPHFKPPTILGHEFHGVVARAPAGHRFAAGDAVVVAPYYECGECGNCRGGNPAQCSNKAYVSSGAFCEYVSVPAEYDKGVFPIPRDIAGTDAADVFTLVEPLACVLNGADRLRIRPTSRVLVTGGGPMGVLFALYYQRQKVPVTVVEPNEGRRTRLRAWGVDCVEPGKADASQYDNVVVAVNKAELVSDYVRSVGNGGTVLAFSGLRKGETFDIDSHAIHYREVTLTGCSGFASSNFNKSFDMIRKDPGHYGRLVTHRLPLAKGREAFEILRGGQAFKIVLKP